MIRPVLYRYLAFLTLILPIVSSSLAPAQAPSPSQPSSPAKTSFPPGLSTARTIAIENDTHVDAVADGAADALRAWGRFQLIDDPTTADVTLRFDKNKDHEGQDSQKPDPATGQTNYSYSMSFSTSIHMKAYYKDADTPFYTTKSDDSKKKAGMACVTDFRTAFRTMH